MHLHYGVTNKRINKGGIMMVIGLGIIVFLLFGYLGHALLYPENY